MFLTSMIPVANAGSLPANVIPLRQPTSSTLVSGSTEAVLVDAALTKTQALELAEWVASIGKRLTATYITHGHGYHPFASLLSSGASPKHGALPHQGCRTS